MATVVKISIKNFNADRLREELAAAGAAALLTGIGWAGFNLTGRIYAPAAARREVGRSSVNGNTVVDFADPGELRFYTTRDLTTPEDTALTNVLTAHNSALLSAEQVRQDQDEADLDAILATERAAFIANLAAWDGLSTANKFVAAKAMFTTIGKLMRFLLRRERGASI